MNDNTKLHENQGAGGGGEMIELKEPVLELFYKQPFSYLLRSSPRFS